MPINDLQAYQIYVIIFSNLLCAIALFAFSYFVYLKAKKTHLLKCYIGIVLSIQFWMVSKVFKSVAPNLGLRWTFVVLQYLGVAFLSYTLVIFAFTFYKKRLPYKKNLILLSLFPILFFLTVFTNPLHMGFYSYFDFYRDRFGRLFYPIQIINYTYMFVAVYFLVKGSSRDKENHHSSLWGKLLALLTLLSLSINFYYILFKIDLLPWIFPFPVFDITPIAISISLFLFMLSVLKFHFFDIGPISYYQSFTQSHLGIGIFHKNYKLFKTNQAFNHFVTEDLFKIIHEKTKDCQSLLVNLNKKYYMVRKKDLGSNAFVLFIEDQTTFHKNLEALKKQGAILKAYPQTIADLQKQKKALALTKAKSLIAQNMHDILGHSLTVVIGYCEWIIKENSKKNAQDKILNVKELLMSSLNDLKNSFDVDFHTYEDDCLLDRIKQLKNDQIELDFQTQGEICPLKGHQSDCLYRLCQEGITNAIKHGNASKITFILRFHSKMIEFYIIDNGHGCSKIEKNYGLKGIEERIKNLNGDVIFGSDGEKGFAIKGYIKI